MAGAVATHSVAARNAGDVTSVDAAALPNTKLDRMLMEIATGGSVAAINNSLGDVVAMVDGVEIGVSLLVVSLPKVRTRSDLAAASAVTRAGGP